MNIFVGTAGWTVPKQHRSLFAEAAESNDGAKQSHLRQFSTRLRCVEINSSFHRPHRLSSWQRWAAETPDSFRFAVKAPKAITHTSALINCGGAMQDLFGALQGLGEKLGPVLFQLPPKLIFDEGVAYDFFTTLRELHGSLVVIEPRHASWFSASADRLLKSFQITRVAADPPKGSPLAAQPGGWSGLRYWRLHGSPHTYYSNYDDLWLKGFAKQLDAPNGQAAAPEVWVIFDNTALGHATANALRLDEALRQQYFCD